MPRDDKEYIEELLEQLADVGQVIYRLQKVIRVVGQWREHVVEEAGSSADLAIDKLLADAYDNYLNDRD